MTILQQLSITEISNIDRFLLKKYESTMDMVWKIQKSFDFNGN